MQVGMVSLKTLLRVAPPFVESAASVDDVAVDGALSLFTNWVLKAEGCRAPQFLFLSP